MRRLTYQGGDDVYANTERSEVASNENISWDGTSPFAVPIHLHDPQWFSMCLSIIGADSDDASTLMSQYSTRLRVRLG